MTLESLNGIVKHRQLLPTSPLPATQHEPAVAASWNFHRASLPVLPQPRPPTSSSSSEASTVVSPAPATSPKLVPSLALLSSSSSTTSSSPPSPSPLARLKKSVNRMSLHIQPNLTTRP
ncbi:hypothetical protein EV182_007912, partial [Spiromyces aspiralis]